VSGPSGVCSWSVGLRAYHLKRALDPLPLLLQVNFSAQEVLCVNGAISTHFLILELIF
ncbi:hypothetical protein AVEN_163809-1, partial [Araneus ventricosus]